MRAWTEETAHLPALRVRVVEVGAAPGEERTLCVTTDPAEAAAAVHAWLERMARKAR